MARTLFASLVALGLLSMPATAPATAQEQQRQPCGDRGDLMDQLKDKYHESQSGYGMTGNGAVVELLTSDAGTWTLVLTFPNGRSCMMATGDGWEGHHKVAGKDA